MSHLHATAAGSAAPERYLPPTPLEWRRRVRALVHALRHPQLVYAADQLWTLSYDQTLRTSVEGVVTQAARDGGVPVYLVERDAAGQGGDYELYWEATMIDPDSGDPPTPVPAVPFALPEALLYHGLDAPTGGLEIEETDCAREWRRRIDFDAYRAARLRDQPADDDSAPAPLAVAADLLEHVAENPFRPLWHSRINTWATQGRIPYCREYVLRR